MKPTISTHILYEKEHKKILTIINISKTQLEVTNKLLRNICLINPISL